MDTFENEIFLELYNVKTDSEEKVNLAFKDEYKQQVIKMIGQIKDYMKNTKDLIHFPDNIYENFITKYHH